MSQATNNTNEAKVNNEVTEVVDKTTGEVISLKKVTVLEHFRKDTVNEFTGIDFEPKNFLKFIGHLIDVKQKSFILERKNKISFIIPDSEGKPLTVVIPNETSNSDVITRVQKTVTEVTAQIFSGFMLEEATPNKMHLEVLASLQSAGIKFSSFTKIGINKGVSTWVQNKRLKVATLAEKTDRLNLRLNCENVVMREELSGKLAIMQAEKEKMLPELKASLAGYLNG